MIRWEGQPNVILILHTCYHFIRILNGFTIPVELALSIVVPIFKGKGDIINCSCYGAVRLLEHGMEVVERVIEKRLCGIVSVDEIQFGFMPVRGT